MLEFIYKDYFLKYVTQLSKKKEKRQAYKYQKANFNKFQKTESMWCMFLDHNAITTLK